MFPTQSTDLSLGAPCRALDAVQADREENLWLAGSCGTASHPAAAIQLIRFHSDVNELSLEQTWEDVPSLTPIACLKCSPSDASLFLTAPVVGSEATLWQRPVGRNDDPASELREVARLLPTEGFGANIVDMAWQKQGYNFDTSTTPTDIDASGASSALTLDTCGHLTLWDMVAPQPTPVRSIDTVQSNSSSHNDALLLLPPPRVAWDPHRSDAVAVTDGSSVRFLDWRTDTSVPTGTVTSLRARGASSSARLCDLDYNPNKPYVLATAGQDGMIRVWDLRHAVRPTLTARGGHSHWCATVQYNPYHDQLVVSTGTDGVVNLWRLSTASSAPLLHETNRQVSRHEGHDSVYAAAWGAADAWIYMTVGFDGRIVLSHVPSKEKYKILL